MGVDVIAPRWMNIRTQIYVIFIYFNHLLITTAAAAAAAAATTVGRFLSLLVIIIIKFSIKNDSIKNVNIAVNVSTWIF